MNGYPSYQTTFTTTRGAFNNKSRSLRFSFDPLLPALKILRQTLNHEGHLVFGHFCCSRQITTSPSHTPSSSLSTRSHISPSLTLSTLSWTHLHASCSHVYAHGHSLLDGGSRSHSWSTYCSYSCSCFCSSPCSFSCSSSCSSSCSASCSLLDILQDLLPPQPNLHFHILPLLNLS